MPIKCRDDANHIAHERAEKNGPSNQQGCTIAIRVLARLISPSLPPPDFALAIMMPGRASEADPEAVHLLAT